VTEACADEILSLPMYPELQEDEVRGIVKLVKEYDEQQALSSQQSAR